MLLVPVREQLNMPKENSFVDFCFFKLGLQISNEHIICTLEVLLYFFGSLSHC
jgi:hypothetical protein